MIETPRANRLHIGLFGRRNAGKSSLINLLTGQQTAIVSDTPGTTADPVLKSMELPSYPLTLPTFTPHPCTGYLKPHVNEQPHEAYVLPAPSWWA